MDGKAHGVAPKGPQARHLRELMGEDGVYKGGGKGKK